MMINSQTGVENRGIHKRVENGRQMHPKVNTCRPWKHGEPRGKLRKNLKRLEIFRVATQVAWDRQKGGLNSTNFHLPGAMGK